MSWWRKKFCSGGGATGSITIKRLCLIYCLGEVNCSLHILVTYLQHLYVVGWHSCVSKTYFGVKERSGSDSMAQRASAIFD